MAQPYNSSMTAQDLGLDYNQLTQIINATHDSSGDMTTLNGKVSSTESNLLSHMRSDAGQILSGKFGIWVGDYNTIKTSLDALNTRATQMRDALVAANTGGTGAAQKSQL